MRRFVPVWENEKYLSPCEAACPTGIPVQRRWQLIRQGREQEAVDMALQFTPFPATICGYLCPHLCMQSCTREASGMQAVDITILGKKGLQATMPQLPKLSGKSVAVIGGGPAGISAAWHLRLAGHQPVVYDKSPTLGGKIASAIPESRIPKEILESELQRVSKVLDHVHLQASMTPEMFQDISARHEFVILATGADQPRTLPVPGSQRLTSALDFLRQAKSGQAPQGKKMVIIGAGNVGCDVATVAGSMGYTDITLIDVQKPASFGEERKGAEKFGAKFRWPCFTKEITDKGVVLTNGEILEADTVIVSIGDQPDTSYLPASIRIERGFVTADENGRTTDPKIFAVGDIVRPGLLTHAVGAGRRAALTIDAMLEGRHPVHDPSLMRESDRTALEFVDPEAERSETIDYSRITLEYFDPRKKTFNDTRDCAAQCSSCGSCRDCGLCVEICPQGAITRVDLGREKFEMVSNAELCIGCGFCAQACPCGIWSMHPNTPLG
jgi:NADPH-dependent glutamate synthase beta subunit-like oxidoreductase/ferredoxin